MPLAVSQDAATVTLADDLAELVADELRDYREERRRLEDEQRYLEEQLAQVKADLKEQEEILAIQLHRGRTVGIGVTKMSQLAGVSRNKAHRVLRAEDGWFGRFDRSETGLTMAAAAELAILSGSPPLQRAAWSETLERYGPQPTAAQTRAVVQSLLRAITRTTAALGR